MAFYLHRAFGDGQGGVRVLNDIRLVDPEQPEHDGRDGACQIDHLVVHRWGVFIVESKSVSTKVRVRPDGSGGDEWHQLWDGEWNGMPSPVRQAERQAEFLRKLLNRHRDELLGKVMLGARTAMKRFKGTDQRGFTNLPIQVIIAVSDNGGIERDGWKEPMQPFRFFVCKADNVTDKVERELAQHRAASGLLSEGRGEYGLWQMSDEEVGRVADFLVRHNTPLASRQREAERPSPTAPRAAPACKKCGSASLRPIINPFSPYWQCADCGGNTAMPKVCSACGESKGIAFRTEKEREFRVCPACGDSERVV